MPAESFCGGMRFTSAQLRLLQDSLAAPVPPLEAPPELSCAPAPRPAQGQSKQLPGNGHGVTAPLALLLAGYLLGAAMLALAAMSSADMSLLGLTLASAFLSPVFLLHSLAAQCDGRTSQAAGAAHCDGRTAQAAGAAQCDGRIAQAAGAACSLLFFPVLTLTPSSRPEPIAGLAVAVAVFFSLKAGQSARFVRACGVLAVVVACAACAAELQRQARVQLWSFSAIFLGLQAAVTSSQLSTFRLFCAVL